MLSCTGKRSHRHTILHVSFSNSFGLASARPTPQGLSGAPYFAEEKISFIRTKLLELDDSKWAQISSLQFKSPTVALVLSIFLGAYGIDRFYIGHIGLGVGKLLTCGGIGIWALIDWFLILGATRNENLKKLEPLLL